MPTIESLTERLMALEATLNLEQLNTERARLKAQSEQTDLWENQENAVQTLSRLSEITTLIETVEELHGFLEMGESLSENDVIQIDQQLQQLEQKALLSGEYDTRPLVTIHAGTGGVDAQDFAEMLQRMILRFVEQGATEEPQERPMAIDRSNWKATILDQNRGEEAGIKKVTIEVEGNFAYGLLQSEAGVHRLVRLSPFNAKNLRQTSFALIEVIPEVEQNKQVSIPDSEVRIDVYRAGGHGGQGVNTTDSAVRITHIPSGIVVAVQNERSQHQNKATAFKILQSRLLQLNHLKNAEETAILKGEFKEGSWGNQIRSYVMQPYQMVKDHRTGYETSDVQGVFNGDIRGFIERYLTK